MFGANKMFLTNRARHSAIWTSFESVLLVWYASSLGRLPDDVALNSPAVISLMIQTVIGVIIVSSIVAVILHFRLPKEPADERDRLYEALAYKDGARAMAGVLILFIAYIFASQMGGPVLDPKFIPLDGVNVTLVLFFTIYLGDAVRRISLVRHYKKGE